MINTENFIAVEAGKVIRGKGAVLRAEGRMLTENLSVFELNEKIYVKKYIRFRYRADGVRRLLKSRAPIAWLKRGEEKIPVAVYDDMCFDNKFHSLAVKCEAGEYDGMVISFSRDRTPAAELELACIETFDSVPDALFENEEPNDFLPVKVNFNSRFELGGDVIIDGGEFFDKKHILGIPFEFEKNCVAVSEDEPKENDEIINNFGVPSKRRLCRPISRNGGVEVKIEKCAKEIFFVLTLDKKRYQRWGYATDGTILGLPEGEVEMPLNITDIEGFEVHIFYSDGRRDVAFPYNLRLKRHCIQGDVGVYGVPADGSRVERIEFINHQIDTDIAVAAVTVNENQPRKYAEMLLPEYEEKPEIKVENKRNVEIKDGECTLVSGGLTLKIDENFCIKDIKNEFEPDFSAAQASMLRVFANGKNVSGETKEFFVKDGGLHASYVFDGVLLIRLRAVPDGSGGIRFSVEKENIGSGQIKYAVQFPVIEKAVFGKNENGWYFLPKYQNLNSNESVFMFEESAPSFPMQFMDMYGQSGGLSLRTEETGLTVRKYGFEKDFSGMKMYVEYPEMYGEVETGETVKMSDTVLKSHAGDWHGVFDEYRDWLKTWYLPYKSQNNAAYRRCFWLIAEITDFFETKDFTRFPIWYEPDKKKFNFLDIMEEQKSITGVYPDILHLWAWTYDNEKGEKGEMSYGNYGEEDYAFYGGVDNFRNALHEVQDKTGAKVSIYLHPTLLTAKYKELAQKYYPTLKVINEQGQNITFDGDSFRMCHANPLWRQRVIEMYKRVYSELDIPLMYVDEFSLRVENRCFAPNHGHHVPSNLLETDRNFISALREAMPEEVVLYGEYAAVDVNARYIDCNISYSILDSIVDMIETAWHGRDGDNRLSPVFTDLYRFAFPGIVQLILPMAMRNLSWHPQKFIFFNGEAIYDSFWDCEESNGLEFTVKAYKIKKKYADCFASDNPETMIKTLTPAVCANRFESEGETLYTFYNRGYTTYRGDVLKVKHVPGARYFDAWNERELKVKISNGFAFINLEIDAMRIGCVVVKH